MVMVRRRSLYTAAVQPPMVFIGVVLTVFELTKAGRFTITVIGLTTAFPAMAAATALVAVVALIRKLSQPLYPLGALSDSWRRPGRCSWLAGPVQWSGMFPRRPPPGFKTSRSVICGSTRLGWSRGAACLCSGQGLWAGAA